MVIQHRGFEVGLVAAGLEELRRCGADAVRQLGAREHVDGRQRAFLNCPGRRYRAAGHFEGREEFLAVGLQEHAFVPAIRERALERFAPLQEGVAEIDAALGRPVGDEMAAKRVQAVPPRQLYRLATFPGARLGRKHVDLLFATGPE